MKNSLKIQLMEDFRTILPMVLIVDFGFIFYTVLIQSAKSSYMFFYMMMCTAVWLCSSLVFYMKRQSNFCRIALSFGATRKGWFLANIISKIVVLLFIWVLFAFVSLPLAALFYSQLGSPAFGTGNYQQCLPLLYCTSLLLSSLGEAIAGFATRFSYKIILSIIIFAMVIALVGGFIFFAQDNHPITISFSNWLAIPLLLLAFACNFAYWQVLRKAEVR